MNKLPTDPLSREGQQKLLEQLYRLMGKQVQSYHRHRRMGISSSVPVELARELMESIDYTVGLVGGVWAHTDAETALARGQELLKGRVAEAGAMLDLVTATMPRWQTECRWEALRCLRHYLDTYDPLHLAHRGPEDLYLPILISPPEGIRGIDGCLFYLNILWIENQILAGVPEAALERFWDRLPAGVADPCEQLLVNGIGKALLGAGFDPLTFGPEELIPLTAAMARATEEDLRRSVGQLCRWLGLRDERSERYAEAVLPRLVPWIGGNARDVVPEGLFI